MNGIALTLAIVALINLIKLRRTIGGAEPLIQGHQAEDLDIRRRRAAKRFNERLKLLANFLNTVGAACLLTILVVPFATADVVREPVLRALFGTGIAAVLHISAQLVLFAWKSEE
ncbi:MAG TPA: hypothetical protein VF649_06620 [Sphingomonas sp.]|uniref:hypothetical protein n=1 Tax=Sphingomonas sp. TaxID=28214 RepID=UPI002EDACAC5